MKTTLSMAFAASTLATGAYAGGYQLGDRNNSIMFEQGTYGELTFGAYNTDISGVTAASLPTGQFAENDQFLLFAFKTDINDKLSFSIFSDKTWDGQVTYPGTFGDPTKPLAGIRAGIDGYTINAAFRYKFTERFSVFAGPTYSRVVGAISNPLASYTLDFQEEDTFGWNAGLAFEIPEYFLYASLTYYSGTDTDLNALETGFGSIANPVQFTLEQPEAVRFDFRTPVSRKLLVFGSVHWANWDGVTIDPPGWVNATGGNLITYSEATTTYRLGAATPINDKLTLFASLGYEDDTGEPGDPYNFAGGFKSVAAGAVYQMDKVRFTGAIEYVDFGDRVAPSLATEFKDNSLVAAVFKIGYSF